MPIRPCAVTRGQHKWGPGPISERHCLMCGWQKRDLEIWAPLKVDSDCLKRFNDALARAQESVKTKEYE